MMMMTTSLQSTTSPCLCQPSAARIFGLVARIDALQTIAAESESKTLAVFKCSNDVAKTRAAALACDLETNSTTKASAKNQNNTFRQDI